MGLFSRKLGVDLGAVNVIICGNGQILLQRACYGRVHGPLSDERIVAIGQEARICAGGILSILKWCVRCAKA